MVQPEELEELEELEEEDGDSLPPRDSATAFYAKYDAREVLGRGVSSTVRRAVLKDTGVSFAVKIIDISQNLVDSDGLSLREQTLREVNILRLVAGHENIIELLDVFESDTFIFLVFELCVNGELFDYLNSVVALSEKRARRVMRQVAEALHHCHRKGVVHRDIKPENILLDDDLNVKLTDFGFAKVLQAGDRLYEVCGTPGYLAPELLKSGMVEERDCNGYGLGVDVWACGVVLYTLLAGFPPFWHRRQLMMIRQIMEGRYSFAGTEWAAISPPPKHLIGRMLEVEPDSRPTIGECLRHEFFQSLSRRNSLSSGSSPAATMDPGLLALRSCLARRRWRLAIIQLRFLARLLRIRETQEPVSLAVALEQPYSLKVVRRAVDGAAFRMYGHWVKRGGEGQNRAAMFQTEPKTDVLRQKMKEEAALSRASLPLRGVGGS